MATKASKKRAFPYVGLAKHKNKPVVEISIHDDDHPPQRFPATKAGFKKAAACLADSGADEWLCSSSLDFPAEVGLDKDLDVRTLLSNLFTELRGRQPVGWWVLATTVGNGELMNWGKDGGTEYPFETEQEAADQAKYMSDHRDANRIYICKIFANGQLRFEEWENGSV